MTAMRNKGYWEVVQPLKVRRRRRVGGWGGGGGIVGRGGVLSDVTTTTTTAVMKAERGRNPHSSGAPLFLYLLPPMDGCHAGHIPALDLRQTSHKVTPLPPPPAAATTTTTTTTSTIPSLLLLLLLLLLLP